MDPGFWIIGVAGICVVGILIALSRALMCWMFRINKIVDLLQAIDSKMGAKIEEPAEIPSEANPLPKDGSTLEDVY